ncbi:MAG: hypothetical protein R2785_03405 [Flavobacteriaceae bacterium]
METEINFNNLLSTLKDEEINRHRIKIVNLSKSLKERPNEKNLVLSLKQSLVRLEALLLS